MDHKTYRFDGYSILGNNFLHKNIIQRFALVHLHSPRQALLHAQLISSLHAFDASASVFHMGDHASGDCCQPHSAGLGSSCIGSSLDPIHDCPDRLIDWCAVQEWLESEEYSECFCYLAQIELVELLWRSGGDTYSCTWQPQIAPRHIALQRLYLEEMIRHGRFQWLQDLTSMLGKLSSFLFPQSMGQYHTLWQHEKKGRLHTAVMLERWWSCG